MVGNLIKKVFGSRNDRVVSFFARYMAICRGRATARARRLDDISVTLIEKGSATFRWISSIEILRSDARKTSDKQSWVRSIVISRPTSDPKAKSRIKAPSSTRTFVEMRCARNSSTPS